MNDFLEKIVAAKRAEVAARAKSHPVVRLQDESRCAPKPRSLRDRLAGGSDVGVIAELKKASPSKGILQRDFDHRKLARLYEESGAAALSVLTEEQFFMGKLDYLKDVRSLTSLPVLRKDFILDFYQVWEARAYHADAILLILALLSGSKCSELYHAAGELEMECLVEVHSAEELTAALEYGFDLIGINNRNLRSFEVDLETSLQLLPLIPDNIVRIAESGIRNRDDVKRLAEQGADAILVGEHFMKTADVKTALTELSGVEKRCG